MKIDELSGEAPKQIAAWEAAWAAHPHRWSEADEAVMKRVNKLIALAQIAGSEPDRYEVGRADYDALFEMMGRVPGFDGRMADGEWEDDITRPIARNQRTARQGLSEHGVEHIVYRGRVVCP